METWKQPQQRAGCISALAWLVTHRIHLYNHCKYPSNGSCMCLPSPSFLTKTGRQPLPSSRGSCWSVIDSAASGNVSKRMHETYGIVYTALWGHSGMTETMRKKSKQKASFYTCSANGKKRASKRCEGQTAPSDGPLSCVGLLGEMSSQWQSQAVDSVACSKLKHGKLTL